MTQGFGFTGGDPDKEPNPMSGLGEMLQSIGRMLSQGSAATSLTAASLRQMASVHMPSHRIVEPKVTAAVVAAGELADLWLDEVTQLPRGPQPLRAWSPQEWLEASAAGWVSLATPVIDGTARASTAALTGLTGASPFPGSEEEPGAGGAMGSFGLAAGSIPPQLAALAQHMTSAMLQQQLASTVAQLSSTALSLSELPFGITRGAAAVMPHEIETFADGLDLPKDHALLWCALRETAYQRLAAHAPWLAKVVSDAIATHAATLRVDTDGLAEAVANIDPMNPESLQSLAGSGLLEPTASEVGVAAAARVEALYALIEGWVDTVVAQAAGERLASHAALAEAFQRRRAAGSPAQTAVGALLGVDLTAKRIRTAAGLWDYIGTKYSAQVRDGLWAHPDLVPGADDLVDPTDFLAALAAQQAGSA